MNRLPDSAPSSSAPPAGPTARRFAVATGVLLLAFALPLFELVRHSLQSDLYSHIVLVPLVSLYFVWQQRGQLPGHSAPHRPTAAILLTAGLALFGIYWTARLGGRSLAAVDSFALSSLSFVLLLAGFCAWLLGRALFRALVFPLAFLLFMVPFPVFVETTIETFLQHGSAAVAHLYFKLAGTTVFVDGLTFQLPGITMLVAPECSGIHSSLALLIVSVVAGRFVLRSPWRRLTLALAVIPLALLRNGLRVFVIGELCVHYGPDMIHSFIHRRGGPIFFALSLVPFFLLLALLVRSERKAAKKTAPQNP